MSKQHHAALAVCVLLIVLAFHLAVAWQDFATLARNGFLYDDSFYAFKIAQNIAGGKGITFDGAHPTTGFQPLYVLLLVPAYMISGDNPTLPIYIALTLLTLFTSLTAYLIYRISNRYVGQAASLAAAAIWAFSPIVTRQSANGLETAIAAFMIALSVYYYLEKVRSSENPSARRLLGLGLLLGLAVLTRIDGVFLVLVILLDQLLLLRKRRVPLRRIIPLSLLPLGVLILYGPWLLFNMMESGSPFQDSGAATRFLSLAYASYFEYGPESLGSKGPDSSFIWAHVSHSVSTLKVIPPVHVIFRSIDKLGAYIGARSAFQIAGNILGFLFLAGFGFSVARWRRDPEKARRSEINFLLLFAGLLLAAYSFYVFGAFFFVRYYYPIYFVACILCAFLLQDAFTWYRERSQFFRRVLAAGAAIYILTFGYFSYSQAFRSWPAYPFYDIAHWVDENTHDDETIGIFQCGTIGYLCDRNVINLDGKVNREALAALKSGGLDDYLLKEGIDIVLDHWRILDIFMGITPEQMKNSCTVVPQGRLARPSGWVAYRRSSAAEIETMGVSAAPGETVPAAPLLSGE